MPLDPPPVESDNRMMKASCAAPPLHTGAGGCRRDDLPTGVEFGISIGSDGGEILMVALSSGVSADREFSNGCGAEVAAQCDLPEVGAVQLQRGAVVAGF